MVANILPADPHPYKYFAHRPYAPDPWGQNLTFSEHGQVAYQIKWNHECSSIVAITLPANPSPLSDLWVKIKLFQNMVGLHIKLKGITTAATCYSATR